MEEKSKFKLKDLIELFLKWRGVPHERIALAIASAGIIVVLGSHVRPIEALLIYLVSSLVNDPDLFQTLLGDARTPWLGYLIIVTSLIYHALMSWIFNRSSASKAEKPSFQVWFKNADSEVFKDDLISLRGEPVSVPRKSQIPTLKPPNPCNSVFGSLFQPDRDTENEDIYRDRALFLRKWAGAELLTLCLKNNSTTLAKSVDIEVILPKLKGVNADVENDKYFLPPSSTTPPFWAHDLFVSSVIEHFDIYIEETETEYILSCHLDELKANSEHSFATYIFLRTEVTVLFKVVVQSNELENSIEKSWKVEPTSPLREVKVSDLKNDGVFNKLVSTSIMNGYIEREVERQVTSDEKHSD